MQKVKKIVSKDHRRFIASLPCCACGIETYSQAAHIRSNGNGGVGYKPHDYACVPLCCSRPLITGCHVDQGKGEINFWSRFGGVIRAKKLAADLYNCTGETEKANHLIEGFRS